MKLDREISEVKLSGVTHRESGIRFVSSTGVKIGEPGGEWEAMETSSLEYTEGAWSWLEIFGELDEL